MAADHEKLDEELTQAADRVLSELERDEKATRPEAIPQVSEEGRRRKELEQVLEHAGRVELELDQEELRRLRESE